MTQAKRRSVPATAGQGGAGWIQGRRRSRALRPQLDRLEGRALLSSGSGTVDATDDLNIPGKVTIQFKDDQTYFPNGNVNQTSSYYSSQALGKFTVLVAGRNGSKLVTGQETEVVQGSLPLTTFYYPLHFTIDTEANVQGSFFTLDIPVTDTTYITANGVKYQVNSTQTTAYFAPDITIGQYPPGTFHGAFKGEKTKHPQKGETITTTWNLRP